METIFFRLKNGQWFQFTGTTKHCESLLNFFDKRKTLEAWTREGVEGFERSYKIKASDVPNLS